MSLAAFQSAIGRAVRTRAAVALDSGDFTQAERERLTKLITSRGFQATRAVQRSWCESRAALGASLTLSMLSADHRRRLTAEWIDRGGGTNSFFAAEADAFLAFIEERLASPSHALSMCQLERAVLRAEEEAARFVSPDLACLHDTACVLSKGSHAALVALLAEPEQLLIAADGRQELPPLSGSRHLLFVAPGLPALVRPATPSEIALWEAVTTPATVDAVLRRGHEQVTVEALVSSGVLQLEQST